MMTEQVIVFCSNYRREFESLNLPKLGRDLRVIYFPARCGMPPVDWSVLAEELPDDLVDKDLHIISCGSIKGLTGGQLITDRHYRNASKQCFNLLLSPELVEHFVQKGYYLVTPGWLGQWRDNLERWGFDRHTAGLFFKESARAVMLLDTGVDPKAASNLTDFASYIGLPCETVSVGLDYLELLVGNSLLKSQVGGGQIIEKEEPPDTSKELADFAMALDFLNSLARMRREDQVLESIQEMFTMLFAPNDFAFRPAGEAVSGKSPAKDGTGFSLPVYGSDGLLGEIEVKDLNQPQHIEQYMKIAGRIVNVCGLAIENARHYQTIKELSDTDGLTGLANRRKLEEHLSAEWRRLKREQQPLALLMCDIDYFKSYNDYYGHQAGDDCLRKVAGVMAAHTRRGGDHAARYGGEEFMVVLPGAAIKGAAQLAEQIRQAVEDLELKHERSLIDKNLTMSIGVAAEVPSDETSVEKLIIRADEALYKAKSGGKNRVVVA